MTVVTRTQQQWNARPGWGIAADLTPPELVTARRLQKQRKVIAVALAVLLVLCGAGYVISIRQHASARDSVTLARDETATLQAQTKAYANVTQIETKTSKINQQLAVVLASDVDFAKLLRTLRGQLPGTMTIKTVSVSLATGAGATVAPTGGHAVIGTVILGGSALTYVDVSHYVDTLSTTAGIVDVVPTSAQASKSGVQYNVTFNITNQLLTHRFDHASSGGK